MAPGDDRVPEPNVCIPGFKWATAPATRRGVLDFFIGVKTLYALERLRVVNGRRPERDSVFIQPRRRKTSIDTDW